MVSKGAVLTAYVLAACQAPFRRSSPAVPAGSEAILFCGGTVFVRATSPAFGQFYTCTIYVRYRMHLTASSVVCQVRMQP